MRIHAILCEKIDKLGGKIEETVDWPVFDDRLQAPEVIIARRKVYVKARKSNGAIDEGRDFVRYVETEATWL